MTDRQKMNELAAMFSSLSRRERYALDAYLANRDDKGARRLAFEMAMDDTPVWTASQWASKTRLFWSRRDVESYMEYKALEARARAAAVSEGYEDDELKTAMMMRREIQRKMAEAEAQNDFDTWFKLAQEMRNYMKLDNSDSADDDSRVTVCVPLVCVDGCPLYRDRMIEIQKRKINENNTEDE